MKENVFKRRTIKTSSSFVKTWDRLDRDPDYIKFGINMDLGEKLLRVMIKRKMTRQELADKMGITKRKLSNLFKGEKNFTTAILVKFCLALDVHLNFWKASVRELKSDIVVIKSRRKHDTVRKRK